LVKNSYSRFYEAPHDDLVVGARWQTDRDICIWPPRKTVYCTAIKKIYKNPWIV